MKVLRDFIDFHCEAMGLSREEYAAYYLSEGTSSKTFEQFSINEEEEKTRSEGFVPATIKRDFEDFKAGTKIAIDALDYSKAGKDDLIVSYLESSDEMIRIPKMLIELEDGEGI